MSSFKDIDRGWDRAKLNILKMDNSFVKVGVQDGSELAQLKAGPGPDEQHEPSELELIAWVNEFGSSDGKIPSRSFIRHAFDQNKTEIQNLQDRLYTSVLLGRTSVRKGLKIMGTFMVSKTQKRITDVKTPANAPRTIKRKGSSNPLIDTGQLRQSIMSKEVMRVR